MRYYFLFSTFILLCFSGCKQEAIQLRFVVISDTHFSPWSGHESVPKALKNLLQKEPLPDAVFVVGDLTEHGWPAEYDAFMATFTDRSLVPEGLEVYLMTGNHDLGRILKAGDDPFEHMSATERYMKKTGQPLHQYVDIKGYPFVTVSMTAEDVLYSGLPEEEVRNRLYDEEALRFLEEKLAEAKRDHPGKPIFLFSHIGSSSSCFGTFPHEDGGQTQFPPILDAYPEVVFFNGHSHFPIGDPRTIHQDRYTSINDGSVSTLAGTKYFIPTPHTPQTNLTQISEGLIVNVWTDGRVEIERWDAARDEEILPRWQLEPPFD
ncbi:MAG: metallophosphoesterase, partial [Tannerellaceae bacterium]|nr:metallophosphoesterase [Tannerellaceae bacterium]